MDTVFSTAVMSELEKVEDPKEMPSPTPSRSSLSEDGDAETVAEGTQSAESDALSILSKVSYPDYFGRRDLLVSNDEPAKTVYEAWEVINGDETIFRSTWKTICGIKIGVKWRSLNDGFIELDPLVAYGQGELADLHTDAVREYAAKHANNGKSYAQDLANRVFGLDPSIYNRIQLLIDGKMKAANKTPFHRREWRIVVLEEGEYQMTELLPERKNRIFRSPEKPAVHRYFIVLRGEVVKTTKESGGWRQFNRYTNPWCRIDMRETRETRREHREYFEKLDRKFGLRPDHTARNGMSSEMRI